MTSISPEWTALADNADKTSAETMMAEDNQWPRAIATWMVAGYMMLFIIRPWEVLAPWMATIKLERHYAIAMILIVLIMGKRWFPTRQCWTLILFTLAIGVSAATAWQSHLSWTPLYRFLTVVIMYYLIVAVCRRPCDLFFLITTYVAVMWAYLTKALWEYFVHGRHQYAQSVSRLMGIEFTFGDPNAVAMSTVVSMPMWWFLLKRQQSLTHDWNSIWKKSYWMLIWTYPMIAFLAVILTNSRAGMVGVAVFVTLILWRQPRTSKLKFALTIVGVLSLLWVLVPQEQQTRLQTLWDPSAGPSNAYASAQGRWEGFTAGMEMLRRFPITGVGIGNFMAYRISHIDGVGLIAHNLPGEILGETGCLGGLAFLSMVVAIWLNCRGVLRCERIDPSHANLAELSRSVMNMVLLMLFFGLSLHNGLRFNWIWMAAFAMLANGFAQTRSHIADP